MVLSSYKSIILPETLPIYPLQAGLMLPGGQMPIGINHQPYINMVDDALALPGRLVGILLVKGKKKSNASDNLYDIGCAGRITSFQETANGNMSIMLTGYCRFQVVNTITTTKRYKKCKVNWDHFKNQDLYVNLNPDIERTRLIKAIKKYANKLSIPMDWRVVDATPSFNLVTFFAMHLPFKDDERQKLLEAETVEMKSALLIKLVEKSLVI